MTDADRLRQVRELFDSAMDLDPGARRAFLDRAETYATEIRREVGDLITRAEVTEAGFAPFGGSSAGLIGQRLGAYHVVRLAGTGGMGAVYEAVRADDQYRKRVAIKVVQGGLGSGLAMARFRLERQILATLEHKNIATLVDGGMAPDGRPFLVMEFVEGQPITTWCDERRLSVADRLRLFRQVCGAVQHAHRKLVIHRDLKPGNILVTADGTVKLLDFGIAKLTGPDSDAEGLPLTRGGARAFTPEYASPEQIRGDFLTTASDVYSLGVVLFELVAGRRPHAPRGSALVDIERAVLDEAVPRPSAVVTEEVAARRGERNAARLRRRLHGELDSVILTAAKTELDGRYASVDALSDDIRRYLEGLPVAAQRGWAGYRVAKFLKRNRGVAAVSALLLIALAGGIVSTVAEARRAEAAQARTERVNGFLRALLRSVKPTTGGRDVPISEVLDSAARRVESELGTDPATGAELETVIGESYRALGRYEDAERHFVTALGHRRRGSGDASASAAVGWSNLGGVLLAKGEIDRADSAYNRALAIYRPAAGRSDSLLASLIESQGSIANAKGRPADAERLHREVLALRRASLGDRADMVAFAMNNVAVALGNQNRWAGAESLHRAAVGILRSNHPEPNALVADAEDALATALDIQGKTAEAESAYVRVLELRRTVTGVEHPQYSWTVFNYAMFTFARGNFAKAAALSRSVLAQRGKGLPESHPAIAASLQTLGRALDKDGNFAGGERSLRESLDLRKRYLPAESWLIASSEGVLADHFILVRDFSKAQALALSADRIMVAALGNDHPTTQTNLRRLVTLYEQWGRPERAAEFTARLKSPAPK